jgi:dephospho-CoA kinase
VTDAGAADRGKAAGWRPLRVGLTGGIASGKSAAAGCFAALGVPVIDTDELARRLTEPGQPALAAIVAAFGGAVLRPDGTLDRRALRGLVFADPGRRRTLEGILHPRIETAVLTACAAVTAPYLVLVVPLLLESGFVRHVDRVLVVDCPEKIQRERLAGRDGETPERIRQMLAAQTGRTERLARADDVLENTGSLTDLQAAVAALHGRYLRLAGSAREA